MPIAAARALGASERLDQVVRAEGQVLLRLGRLLTTVFGAPSFSVGRVLAWRR